MDAHRHPPRRREGLMRVALILVSSALAFGVAEIALRIVYPIHGVIVDSDPRYLFRLRPGSSKIHIETKTDRRKVRVEVNRRGFRGPELESSPERRVVIYGDSFIAAEFSPWEKSLAPRLAAHLSAADGERVEVVNAGVFGYGPDQAYLRMVDEIDVLEPDLVILALFAGNDFGDLIRNKIFKLDTVGNLVERQYGLHPDLVDGMKQAPRKPILFTLGRNLTRRLRRTSTPDPAANETTLTDQLTYWRGYQIAELNDFFASDTVGRLFEDYYDVQMATEPHAVESRMKALLMLRVLERFKLHVESRGVTFLLLLIPAALDVCEAYAAEVDRAVYPGYRPTHLRDLLLGIARRTGAPFVDLWGPFRETGACDLYFQGWGAHWNDQGQAVAAELLAERIRPLLDP